MKKIILTTIGLLTILNAQIIFANSTAIPAPPHNHQFNFEAEAGTKQSSSIIIKNLGTTPETYKLYSVDATQSAQGTFAVTTQTAEQKHIGNWIKFEEEEITIPQNEERKIAFLIEIPETTTPGSYSGGIAIEEKSKNNSPANKKSSSVNISSRFIVKIFLNIPGEINHNYSWDNFYYQTDKTPNKNKFIFEVSNTGNTILLVEPEIELSGFPKLKEPILKLPVATIQPNTKNQKIEVKLNENIKTGFYKATGKITFSRLDIAKNEKTNSKTELQIINLTPRYYIAIIVIILLIVIFKIIFYFLYKKHLIKICTKHIIKEDETIINIAEKYKVDWEKIVKINKLSPPYTLTTDETLLIPLKKKQK